MIKGKELLGKNIVTIDTGQRVETVHDLVFDPQANQLLGLIVEEGGWFRAAKAVRFESVRSFGEDAIMIADQSAIIRAKDDDRLARVMDADLNLIGLTLLTESGQKLGRIVDVYFDERTGRVEGYEATGGFLSDLSQGRTFIPGPADIQIGTDAAIVPTHVVAAMNAQRKGGIVGAFQDARDNVRDSVQDAAGAVKGSYEHAAQDVREGVTGLGAAVREQVTGQGQAYVVGKQASHEIVAEDGTVIVRAGETITPLHAEVAEWHGKLGALGAAATGGAVAGAYREAADTARQGLQTAGSNVRENLEDLSQASRVRQKEYVTGRTVGYDVNLPDGDVLIRQGETITPAHADRAEADGLLAALITAATTASVSRAYSSTVNRIQGDRPAAEPGPDDRPE